jgi:hypothetical protein
MISLAFILPNQQVDRGGYLRYNRVLMRIEAKT